MDLGWNSKNTFSVVVGYIIQHGFEIEIFDSKNNLLFAVEETSSFSSTGVLAGHNRWAAWRT